MSEPNFDNVEDFLRSIAPDTKTVQGAMAYILDQQAKRRVQMEDVEEIQRKLTPAIGKMEIQARPADQALLYCLTKKLDAISLEIQENQYLMVAIWGDLCRRLDELSQR